MANMEDLIAQVSPQWRPSGPTGGFIATELKKIHDDSVNIFPESVYNGDGARRQSRWKSTMHSDFIPIDQLKAQAEMRKFGVKAQMGNAPEDDVGVAGTLGGACNSMFQAWKVPSRLTDSEGRSAAGSRASVASVAQAVQELRIDSSLPQINGASPRPGTGQSLASFRPASMAMRKVRQPKSLAARSLFDQYHPRDERSTSERWLAQASTSEVKMVERAMKIGESQPKDDVATPVKKWLEEATPKERDVALTFFKSLAGTQLMGGNGEKKERMDQVVNLLENPPNKYVTDIKEVRQLNGGMRYIKVLSPSARKNKWRHQTWHNLPSYPNRNKVLNKSSILVEPHGTVARHFTIHPDWGP